MSFATFKKIMVGKAPKYSINDNMVRMTGINKRDFVAIRVPKLASLQQGKHKQNSGFFGSALQK
jgi:hypothetical protein